MAINKVNYGNKTLIDLTSDTVTADSLAKGITAHDKTGNVITGTHTEKTGVDTSADTAIAADILKGKTAHSASGAITGSMTDNGTITKTITSKEELVIIPKGYHDGNGSVSISIYEQDKIISENIKSGVTILGVQGTLKEGSTTIGTDTTDATATANDLLSGSTAYAKGEKLTGTMINNGAVSGTISAKSGTYTIPKGYHDGKGSVGIDTTEQNKIIASNIRSGVSILGVTGTLEQGSTLDTSDATATASQILDGQTAYVNGEKIIGSMANNGAVNQSIGVDGSYTIPEGYHDGTGKVTNSVANKGAITGSVDVGGTYSSTQNGYVTSIRVTGPTLTGNATADQVLSGATFYSSNGTKQTGTLVVQHFYTGTGDPSSTVGNDGDIYLQA